MESELRIGSLCTGYGGLDIAALAVFGGRFAWCADNDKHVSTILAARLSPAFRYRSDAVQ